MLLDPYPYLYFKVTEIQSSLFIFVHLCSSLFILNHLGSSSYIFINLCTTFVSNFWSLCNFCSSTSWFVWIWLTQCVLYKKGISSSCPRCMGPVQADIPDWHYVRTLLFFEVQNAELFCDQKVYIWKCQRSNQVRD